MTRNNPDDQELDEELRRASASGLDALNSLVDVEACLREQRNRMTIRKLSQEPLEISHANRNAVRYLLLGACSAAGGAILKMGHAQWSVIFAMGLLTLLFMCLHNRHSGYARGYRRGLDAGMTWRDDVPLPTSDKP